jgi:hypothetical protein
MPDCPKLVALSHYNDSMIVVLVETRKLTVTITLTATNKHSARTVVDRSAEACRRVRGGLRSPSPLPA